MVVNGVSVIVSKKVGQEFCSWNISYGVTGDLVKNDNFEEVLVETETRLKALLKKQLPIPEAVQLRLAKANSKV